MRLRFITATLTTVLGTLAVQASTFNLNFSGSGESGKVLLTANSTAIAGEFLITAASGTIDGSGVALLAPGAYPMPFPNDNLLFYPASASVASFDLSGVSFALGGGNDFNLYSQAGQYFATSGAARSVVDISSVSVTSAAAVTPEPSSLLLFGTGLLAAAGAARRRLAERVGTSV